MADSNLQRLNEAIGILVDLAARGEDVNVLIREVTRGLISFRMESGLNGRTNSTLGLDDGEQFRTEKNNIKRGPYLRREAR